MLRSAIIGCGQMAGGYDEHSPAGVVLSHAKAYCEHPETDLVAVCDVDVARAKAFASRWGARDFYADARTLLKEIKPDIVSICTPDSTHGAILRACLDAKPKAVWCEKPLTNDESEGRYLVEEFDRRGIPLAVNYSRRWDRRLQWLGEELRSAADTTRGVVFYGKGLRHNGSHAIDLLLQWFGAVTDVRVLGSGNDYSADDPTISAQIQFESGAEVQLIAWDESLFTIWEIDLLTARGRYRLLEAGQMLERYRLRNDPRFAGYVELDPVPERETTDLHRLALLALENIVDAVLNNASLLSSGRTALNVLRVCNSIIHQAERLQKEAPCLN